MCVLCIDINFLSHYIYHPPFSCRDKDDKESEEHRTTTIVTFTWFWHSPRNGCSVSSGDPWKKSEKCKRDPPRDFDKRFVHYINMSDLSGCLFLFSQDDRNTVGMKLHLSWWCKSTANGCVTRVINHRILYQQTLKDWGVPRVVVVLFFFPNLFIYVWCHVCI